MALIAPGVCRFIIDGDYAGEDMLNIVDMQVDTTGSGVARPDALFTTAGDILNNWNDHLLPALAPQYTAQAVRWVDLDDADGTTGSRSSTSDNTWPAPGEQGGLGFPGNVYAKVTKVLAGKTRQQRNGTMRLGAIPEAATSGTSVNVINDAGFSGFMQTGLDDFLDGINDVAGLGGPVQRAMVVVHTVDDVFTEFSEVESLVLTGALGTLRRRMPGYGD